MLLIDRVVGELKKSGADIYEIGKSVCGKPVLTAHAGSYYGKQIIMTAAIHARECYTALVVLRQLREFKSKVGGAYFVPLVNPDGATFFESGDSLGSGFLQKNKHRRLEWKANARGVDLNTNFDANWGTGEQNKRVAGASDYIGSCAMSEPETLALAKLTQEVSPSMTVSYHCMGGELYWEFFQSGMARARDENIAARIAEHISVKKVDGDLNSAGGYKDWCVQKLGIPAVTIELIKSGSHPFPPQAYAEDIEKNAGLPEFILRLL